LRGVSLQAVTTGRPYPILLANKTAHSWHQMCFFSEHERLSGGFDSYLPLLEHCGRRRTTPSLADCF
jgi:hypothetical protein